MSQGESVLHDPVVETVQRFLRRIARRLAVTDDMHNAWHGFVKGHQPLIEHLVSQSSLEVPDAESVVQEIWIDIVVRLPALKPGANPNWFVAWLAKVVRSRIADQQRRARRDAAVSIDAHTNFHEHLPDPPAHRRAVAGTRRTPGHRAARDGGTL